jgi:hypothetical protein
MDGAQPQSDSVKADLVRHEFGMKRDRKKRRRPEEGIALLIAIFVLLLISVVAIALLVSSGTETALGANYRASSTVYYAALAGLEEARGRSLPKNPNSFGLSVPALVYGTTLPLGNAVYVLNQLPGETIVPWDSSDKYYDNEYQREFGVVPSSNSSVTSVWDNNVQGIPGPTFKWVRINAVTEQSLYLDINHSGSYNSSTPIFYDLAHLDSSGNPWPSLIESPALIYRRTSTGTHRSRLSTQWQPEILQYLVAPIALNLNPPSALTMSGNNVTFSVPSSSSFWVSETTSLVSEAARRAPTPL